MTIKYNAEIRDDAIASRLKKITNQIYKLLPEREEGLEWEVSLSNLMEELAGMSELLNAKHEFLFPLMCKLEGLFSLTKKEDFSLYRRTIFESISLVGEMIKSCQD